MSKQVYDTKTGEWIFTPDLAERQRLAEQAEREVRLERWTQLAQEHRDRERALMNEAVLNTPAPERSGEVRVVDARTGGEKGSKAERYDLVPWEAMDQIARVYGRGAEKYAPRNWEKGYSWGLSIASLFRHISQFAQGVDHDPETGLPHLAHAAWHCLTLLTFAERFPELDDRAGADEEDEECVAGVEDTCPCAACVEEDEDDG